MLGLEREPAHKSAGLRRHMLVAGAAAMLVGLVDALLHRFLLPAISPLRGVMSLERKLLSRSLAPPPGPKS